VWFCCVIFLVMRKKLLSEWRFRSYIIHNIRHVHPRGSINLAGTESNAFERKRDVATEEVSDSRSQGPLPYGLNELVVRRYNDRHAVYLLPFSPPLFILVRRSGPSAHDDDVQRLGPKKAFLPERSFILQRLLLLPISPFTRLITCDEPVHTQSSLSYHHEIDCVLPRRSGLIFTYPARIKLFDREVVESWTHNGSRNSPFLPIARTDRSGARSPCSR
jgi:hypothetical protein